MCSRDGSVENDRTLRLSDVRSGNPALNDMLFVFQGMVENKMTTRCDRKGGTHFPLTSRIRDVSWGLALTGNPELAALVMTLGFVVNGIFYIIILLSWFVSSMRNLFSNPVFVLGYASAQGFYLAGITFMIENSMGPAYSGISIQAFLITAMIFGGMLGIYIEVDS